MGELLVGLVGCGRISERGYAAAFRRASGVRLAAVADLDPGRCALVAPGIPAYESAGELVEAGRVDAVVVATPAACHLADAAVAARAGITALVEKPPGLDVAEAEALAQLAPPPWLGFNRRFEPALGELRAEIPRRGRLDLRLRFHARRAAWGALAVRDDILLDLGPHLVDLCRWLSGREVARVSASARDQRVTMRIELEGGRGHALLELAGDRPYREHFEVRGAGGFVGGYRAGGPARRLALRLRRGEHALVPSLARQLEAFAATVRGSPAGLLATALDGVAVMAALGAARRSIGAEGRWEPVSEPANQPSVAPAAGLV